MITAWLSYVDLILLIPMTLLCGVSFWRLAIAVFASIRDPELHTSKKNLGVILVLTIVGILAFFLSAAHFLTQPIQSSGQNWFRAIHAWVIGVLCIYGGLLSLLFVFVPIGKLRLNRNE